MTKISCTVEALREMLSRFPGDIPVLIDAYEMGYVGILVLKDGAVFERDETWQDLYAPMLGTHADASDRNPDDAESFRALIISRNT